MLRVAVAIAPEVRQLLREDPSQLSAHGGDPRRGSSPISSASSTRTRPRRSSRRSTPRTPRPSSSASTRTRRRRWSSSSASRASRRSPRRWPPTSAPTSSRRSPTQVGENLLESLEKVDPEAAAEVEELAQVAGGQRRRPDDHRLRRGAARHHGGRGHRAHPQGRRRGRDRLLHLRRRRAATASSASPRSAICCSLAPARRRLAESMTENVIARRPRTTDQEDVARTMAKYDFAALPVLGPDRKLLGVITFDDVMDVLTQEQTEDVQTPRRRRAAEEGYFQTSFWTFIRKRGRLARHPLRQRVLHRHGAPPLRPGHRGGRQAQLLRAAAHLHRRQLGLAVGVAHHPRARGRRHQARATGGASSSASSARASCSGSMLAAIGMLRAC